MARCSPCLWPSANKLEIFVVRPGERPRFLAVIVDRPAGPASPPALVSEHTRDKIQEALRVVFKALALEAQRRLRHYASPRPKQSEREYHRLLVHFPQVWRSCRNRLVGRAPIPVSYRGKRRALRLPTKCA